MKLTHHRFFSFVDTVSARNFAGTNDPHGWIGLRFQLQPGGPPHDVLLHVNMLDPSNVLQQEAIGILGVNLIYTAFYGLQSKESFLEGLAQDVVKERIEIDYVDFRGPAFESWDRGAVLALLVSAGLAEAVFFSSKGPAAPPTEALYKKAVVLAPGYFRHVDQAHAQVHASLLASGIHELRNELGEGGSAPVGFFGLTVAPDNRTLLSSILESAHAACDLLITTGGPSNGRRDFVKGILKDLGAKFFFEEVAMRPGKPFGFATWNDKPICVLPGNPVAAYVSFVELVRLALARLSGRNATGLTRIQARLHGEVHAHSERCYFVLARLELDSGGLVVIPLKNQCSALVRTAADSNAIVVVHEAPAAADSSRGEGDLVEVDVLRWPSTTACPRHRGHVPRMRT